MKNDTTLTVRLPADLRRLLEARAERERRSLASTARLILERELATPRPR